MESKIELEIEKQNKNQYWIFMLAIYSTFQMVDSIYKTIKQIIFKMDNILLKDLPIFQIEFWGNASQFITVIILFYIYKKYIKLSLFIKKSNNDHISDIENTNTYWHTQMQYVSSEITKNLNDSNILNDTKIRYVEFRQDNKHLDNETYIKNLYRAGFSKEDLEEIGVDDEFINKNKDRLYPRKIMAKYKEFKCTLNEYNKGKTK